jgi:hypothetical protein
MRERTEMSREEAASPEERRDAEDREDPLVAEEVDAAADEAAGIGGSVPSDTADPAEQPLIEGGEGEAEGFELAEERLEDVAAHGDQHRFPGRDAPPPEEPADAEFGEADQAIPDDE